MLCSGGRGAVVAWTSGQAVVQTGGVEIEISGDAIRLGQLLKFANLVTDGGEAKALIASGMVRVDGEREIRRGRQVGIGSRVEVDLPHGCQELRVVQLRPVSGDDPTSPS
jgi:ribosome-associated protein